MKNILTYIEGAEPTKLSLESLTKASEVAREKGISSVALVTFKTDEKTQKTLRSSGADKIVEVIRDEYNLEDFANIIYKISKKYESDLIFIPATLDGKDLAAYVAAKYETTCESNVSNIVNDEDLKFISPIYGSAVLAETEITKSPKIITIRSGSFERRDDFDAKGEIITEDVEKIDLKAIIKNIVKAESEVNLEDAPVIITCGRGAVSEKSFALVKELAEVLSAPISGTRPVIDDGILPKSSQIGQSGKIVSPKLYIGCGVSGAVQHISGMQGSKFIVAINKDEDAPIFDIADIGIVGDCESVLPLFIEEIKKIKAE